MISKFLCIPISNNLFMDGGIVFMTLILICLLLSVFFIFKGFVLAFKSTVNAKKMLRLAGDTSVLGLVLGLLGSVLGLISAFDAIESMGNVEPSIFAGGLKIALLTTTFGLFSFAVARIGILVLRLRLPSRK